MPINKKAHNSPPINTLHPTDKHEYKWNKEDLRWDMAPKLKKKSMNLIRAVCDQLFDKAITNSENSYFSCFQQLVSMETIKNGHKSKIFEQPFFSS